MADLPYKNLKSPAKNSPESNLPEKKQADPKVTNGESCDEAPGKNPCIEWPAAEPPEKKPMRLTK